MAPMNRLAYFIHLAFTAYTVILFIRVVGSWFPSFSRYPFMRWIFQITEPYLMVFRCVIPPIGGMLDLSPLIGFFFLQIAEQFIFFLLRSMSF
jgi:YggT family protein